jgi:hypothetical protein
VAFTLPPDDRFAWSVIFGISTASKRRSKRVPKIVETEAKRVIGTYDYGWPELAESTQADRVRQGCLADEPLLRTGDSIEHTIISDHEAQVGSNNDIAVYQELGTSRIPPRSFLAQAAVHAEKEVAHEMGRHLVQAMLPRGVAVPEPDY